jgi:putative nucleotidyltransferase with HDIG domain
MSEATIDPPIGRARQGATGSAVSLSPFAWGYWAATVGAGIVIGALALQRIDAGTNFGRFLALSVLASVAQLAAVQRTRNRVFHPALVFVLAGVLLLRPQELVLMCVIQHLPDWLRNRYAWYIQPFNIANYVIAGGTATVAAHAVVEAAGSDMTERAAAGVVGVLLFVAINRTLLGIMLRLGRGRAIRETGLLSWDDLALELVLATMGIPLALAWQESKAVAVLALAPLVLIDVTQRASERLERASETIQEQNDRLLEANQLVIERSTAALEALSATVDARDSYTAGHSRRVRDIALRLGEALNLDDDELETLGQAALLHDIGKIAVPDAVLLKDGPLTASEWLLMRGHAQEGARIISALGYLESVVPVIRHHHERYDGAGYPDGLSGEAIPLAARAIHVADTLDAMTSKRVYRDANTYSAALTEIRRGSGTDFCPACVGALAKAHAEGALDQILQVPHAVASELIPLRASA